MKKILILFGVVFAIASISAFGQLQSVALDVNTQRSWLGEKYIVETSTGKLPVAGVTVPPFGPITKGELTLAVYGKDNTLNYFVILPHETDNLAGFVKLKNVTDKFVFVYSTSPNNPSASRIGLVKVNAKGKVLKSTVRAGGGGVKVTPRSAVAHVDGGLIVAAEIDDPAMPGKLSIIKKIKSDLKSGGTKFFEHKISAIAQMPNKNLLVAFEDMDHNGSYKSNQIVIMDENFVQIKVVLVLPQWAKVRHIEKRDYKWCATLNDVSTGTWRVATGSGGLVTNINTLQTSGLAFSSEWRDNGWQVVGQAGPNVFTCYVSTGGVISSLSYQEFQPNWPGQELVNPVMYYSIGGGKFFLAYAELVDQGFGATYNQHMRKMQNPNVLQGPSRIVSEASVAESQIKVFPNPTTNEFTLNSTDTDTPVDFQVFDMNGKMILSQKANLPIQFGMDLPPGTYMLWTKQGNVHRQKLVKSQ